MKSKRNQRSQSRRPARRGTRSRAGAAGAQPPSFTPTIKSAHRFRFSVTSTTVPLNTPVTRKNILNLVLMATSASTTVRLLEGVRLKSVEMWTNPILGIGSNAASPLQTCSIEWIGENSPSTIVSDTSMGMRSAHVFSRPPPSASNRWWSITGSQETDNLFTLSAPPSTIIDVVVELRFVEQEAPTAGDVPAGATLGQVYGNYLDGITTGYFAPLGYIILP
jgi:hypothetical protein